jgi:hypothetical protein
LYPPFIGGELPFIATKLAIGIKFPEMTMAIAYTTEMVTMSVIVVV